MVDSLKVHLVDYLNVSCSRLRFSLLNAIIINRNLEFTVIKLIKKDEITK